MYFQIENTPEHIRRARRRDVVPKKSPKEECPRLILAPFTKPPQIVFENVLIGATCERNLEVFNPYKQVQQITLGKSLPPGLVIQLPGEWLLLEPETCYCVTLMWTPTQPTAIRETIRFTNKNRGQYDIIVVLKSVMNIKGKGVQPKGFKISPGKIKKNVGKKSPVAIYKQKSKVIYNTTQIKKTYNVIQTQQQFLQASNKENMSINDYSIDSRLDKCPFDSPSSIDFNFDTSEVFSNMRRPDVLQETYDKSYIGNNRLNVSQNVLKPSNRQTCDISATELFDNLTFTPLKIAPSAKADKLNKGPKIILSMNSESDFDDSLDMKQGGNKENQTHSIISVTSAQPPNKWLTVNHHTQYDSHIETPNVLGKKHPNTSSPKELNSPNFSINTEFSRISDLSFFPQRFSTERKCFPKVNNETQDLLEDPMKLSSDTYTKDSPNTPIEPNFNQMYDTRPPHFFMKDQPKMCRQALFREYQYQKEAVDQKNIMSTFEHNVWQNDLRVDTRSPPRSITPPLQSIPEESVQFSETQVLDRTNKHKDTFTINRTFDKSDHFTFAQPSNRQSWSKKSVRAEPDLWKIPISHVKKAVKNRNSIKSKDSICGKVSNTTFDSNKSSIQNMTVNQIGNVYSQSSTVDPFVSSTYFYDEEAVEKFETEFKRWLNCVLTPPADLESNIEQKIDVGKAWIENRNKDVPVAPTKEQVSSAYHNSHRLESLRRSARTLLMSPEIAQVFQKLTLQIEKKLIAIRTDRNLHLDVGLQKIIMELLLSYNPLWLRIGLEAIYGLVLPLKSNSDIEGLTTFIIQRMFKNPFLRNKHSKSNAPNMLLPAYMEAIKKFTLKKFFMLVYFLDQAKQRKLISHDPCLFCRNAVCKESREIIIRFTRELIAGIGDITKHLRPLGYVVSHKQSYLDEYKYAVHNIALDIRDGVRLVKVMEIILMKDGLITQLRTPAISRLQKIHNVQVALNAIKEANFVIHGDITATDIADGHREKTLSLLWQIIHVFRAPLFEKAANIIQTWWRKKYEVIVEKKKEAERILQKQNNAASLIQCWWRRIQYNRLVEWKMQQITTATIVVQKYCRMWLCRIRLLKYKRSVLKIEEWYRSVKMMQEAKSTLERLRLEREELRRKSVIVIQSYFRRWLCMKDYTSQLKKIVLIQTLIRQFIARKQYVQFRQAIVCIQQRYKAKLLMRQVMHTFAKQRNSAIVIQSYYRMIVQRKQFLRLKNAVKIIEERYTALVRMRNERYNYLDVKRKVIKIQTLYRRYKCVDKYLRQRKLIISLQRKIRAHQLMKKEKESFFKVKNATVTLQKYVKSYLTMKVVRRQYITLRQSIIVIQRYFRAYVLAKSQRVAYTNLRNATIILQKSYRSMLLTRKERTAFLELRKSTLIVQRRYRAQILMKNHQKEYRKLRQATVTIQRKYRALIQMRFQRSKYLQIKSSCTIIQNAYRAFVLGRRQRQEFLLKKQAAINIQNWFRRVSAVKQQYQQSKQACVTIQRVYRAYIMGRIQRQEFIRIKTATVIIQKYYRAYIEMKVVRRQYIQLKTATVTIQRYYKSHLVTKKQRQSFIEIKNAALFIAAYYKRYKETKMIRHNYCQLQEASLCIQRRYRSICAMKVERENFFKAKRLITLLQQKYKAILAMRRERQTYLLLRKATITIQMRFRAYRLMKQTRINYIITLRACRSIQRFYRAYVAGTKQRETYLELKKSAITLQRKYRAIVSMRQARNHYLASRTAAITIQRWYKAHCLVLKERKVIYVQRIWKSKLVTRLFRCEFLQKRMIIIKLQSLIRGYLVRKYIQAKREDIRRVKGEQRQYWAASKIQALCRGHIARQNLAHDKRVAELRRRWRDGGLKSSQESMKERNEEAMEVLRNISGIETVIKAFRSLELLTEVFPMMYNDNASAIVHRVYTYMSVTNRSISSIEVLKSAAAVLVNLTRYRVTGPKIYLRDRIPPILKFMWRFSNSETQLFCIMATYLWLFSKYESVRKDLTELLNLPENHRMLVTIKSNVDRTKRMTTNIMKNKYHTPQPSKFILHTSNQSLNMSVCSIGNSRIVLPAVEPDYGIVRVDKPRYFEDAQQAINCLFHTYKL